jgi:hypothetical protein
VWVAEPTPPVAPRETEWDFASSYLFLVEDISDISTGPMMFSGISALRFVVIAAMSMGDDTHTLGELFLDARREEDKFGRWFHDDPVEKLVGIGGVPSRPREIESVYKIAYMSDEQSYTTETGQERVCDIFAYPLYIAE